MLETLLGLDKTRLRSKQPPKNRLSRLTRTYAHMHICSLMPRMLKTNAKELGWGSGRYCQVQITIKLGAVKQPSCYVSGQEFGKGLAGRFSLGVSHGLIVKYLLGCGYWKVQMAYLSKMAARMAVGQPRCWLRARLRPQTTAPTCDSFGTAVSVLPQQRLSQRSQARAL